MSVSAVQFNPFQAPVVEPEILKKTPKEFDVPYGEYRVVDNSVCISGDVEFPPICVYCGDTDGLVQKTATVHFRASTEFFVEAFFSIMGHLAAFGLLAISAILGSQYRPYNMEATFSIFVTLLALAGTAFKMVRAEFHGGTTIRYYESAQWRADRTKRNRRRFLLAYAFVVLSFIAVWRFFDTPVLFPLLYLMPLAWRSEIPPFTALRHHDGVYVLARMPVENLRDTHFPDHCVSAVDERATEEDTVETSPGWMTHIAG